MKQNKVVKFPSVVPEFEHMELDPERPALEQFEEKLLQAESRVEFDRGLKWLEKNYYRHPGKSSLMNSMESSTPTKDK